MLLCVPTVAVIVWLVSMVAPAATATSSVIVSSSTTTAFCSVSDPEGVVTEAPVRLRPRSVTAAVSPGEPAPGRIFVRVGTPAATTWNSVVTCPLSVVTISSRGSLSGESVPAIVSVAVSVPSSGVATCVIATPACPDAPEVMTSAAPVR